MKILSGTEQMDNLLLMDWCDLGSSLPLKPFGFPDILAEWEKKEGKTCFQPRKSLPVFTQALEHLPKDTQQGEAQMT